MKTSIKLIAVVIAAVSFNASAVSLNGMSKADKAAAAGVSTHALNTASRAAAAQSGNNAVSTSVTDSRSAAMAADHAAKMGAQMQKANQTRTQQQVDANKNAARGASLTAQAQQRNVAPVGISDKNAQMAAVAAAPGVSIKNAQLAGTAKVANSAINVDASTLGNKPVSIDGKTVAASSLPAGTQVSVPMDSAFSRPAPKGGHDHSKGGTTRGGNGNGANNAANSRSANGLGGDNHIGGGSAQSGSRNVGHW
ncbi:TPA: hypothetical protein L1197_003352 [Escherichia coli]|nr:hypothetical protein [Escherichia coli]HBN1649720.1 hypothetical protein [Escherichia coli]HBN2107734.1 hypothetical protein [Escherichia coli]HDS8664508.1 hypothetical protein [Escherichia coli]